MNVIEQIESQGIIVSFYDGKIKLEPVEKITSAIVAEVKRNKARLIEALRAKQKSATEIGRTTLHKTQLIEALRADQTTSAMTVQKMDVCLHGSRCSFMSLVDDRQICGKNNQPIFDMDVCPDGRWWTPKLVDKAKATTVQPPSCYCCGNQTFWRKKDNINGRWICEVCHPPVLTKDEIEWLQ